MIRRQIEITIETSRVLLVRRSGRIESRCPRCVGEVKMLTSEEATDVTGLSQRAIFRLAEANLLHWTETPGGLLLVCPASLQ